MPVKPSWSTPSDRAAVAAWVAPLLAILGILAVVFILNVRDREHAYQLANSELLTRLDSGERVLHKARVLQRRWYNLYRATYGVLAATDRQVLFVGVVPELYPSPDNPRVFDVKTFPYDSIFHMSSAEVPLSVTGVKVTSAGQTDHYGIPRQSHPAMVALITLAANQSSAMALARQRARQFRDSVAALPPIREYYRVQRGDALEIIAKRYTTTSEELRGLNRLLSDRIVVGQELLVRETPRPIPPCPSTICGIISASGGEIQPPRDK